MSYLPHDEFETNVYSYDEVPENKSWASTLPTAKGLYNPEYEKDACGVGFTCHIKGQASHKIVSDCRNLLCNMTHRGGELNPKDGDGAGLLSSLPHKFLVREFQYHCNVTLPPLGQYGTGNVFFKKDDVVFEKSKKTFENIAASLGLRVLGWRAVPHDSSILGPASLSREPLILQPLIVLAEAFGPGSAPQEDISTDDFEKKYQRSFEKNLFILRKQSSHTIGLHNWFYICSLSNRTIVYKGQLAPNQVYAYYHDLVNADFEAHFALVHSRFSTNTFPSWDRAQPLRWAAHNGEINTLRGNKNWMRAKEGVMASELFGDELDKLYPIIEEGGSDSAAFDNVLELLVINGVLSLPEAVMVMIPEAWQNDTHIDPKKKAFYEWAACLMEPWDGPALFTFADGRYCGANLDRNGLRPCRYYVTDDDRMICASEVGVIEIEPEKILQKGRLQPGRMLLVDTKEGRIVDDRELKKSVASRFDFKSWVLANMITMNDLTEKLVSREIEVSKEVELSTDITVQSDPRLVAFGYSHEQITFVLAPMAEGNEALGSMGNDNALACISEQPKLLFDYFRQLFAQVTNPPIDPIREKIVMSLDCYVGPQGNLLEMKPDQCNRLLLKSPILSTAELINIKHIEKIYPKWSVAIIDTTFEKADGIQGYLNTIDLVCQAASKAIADNNQIIILSDRSTSATRVPISSLIATGAVHHHLVRQKQRSKVALIIETAEAREVHHACCLVGYGADAINPYLAIETLIRMNKEGLLKKEMSDEEIIKNYKNSVDAGILKVMSKMGISTLASYKGAQIFEALGVDNSVIDRCFAGTASRIKGVTFEYIAQDAFSMHERGYPNRDTVKPKGLPETGEYHWRDGGDAHINEPVAIASMQDAVRNKNEKAYETYSKKEYEAIKNCTLRGLLDFDFENSKAVPIDQVEPWTEIVRRFFTGAMSYGSISMEAHSTIAVAMNRLGGKSNTGEGGEDAARSQINANGDTMRSAIKQIASGRFGVTSYYLADADELQIKMAQGAKPGEGGELPGHKVSAEIGKTRHSTPGVGLISPPPHHDIYSIEDLKQLLYDLKCSNPRARTSVKLVSEVGVGIVAAGVAKAGSENILVSGGDGGTGAAKLTSIKYAGLPWELGLAESHQTLVLNDLRGRVVLQTDGQIRTGRDIAVAALLGAEEWGFATTPLIAMGCIMMRKCLASDTLVRTTQGLKKVKDVSVGEYLYGADNTPVLCIGANAPETGSLKEIVYEDFDSKKLVSFKCTPDHHLELVLANAAPELSGSTVTWFSSCTGEHKKQDSTFDLESIVSSFYNDLVDSDDIITFDNVCEAIDVALDEHYHRGGSDRYSEKFNGFITQIANEELKSNPEFVRNALHEAAEKFMVEDAPKNFAVTSVSVETTSVESQSVCKSSCACGGVRKIVHQFETIEEAEMAYSLLLSDVYDRVDPSFVSNGYKFQASVEALEKMCSKDILHNHLHMYRAPAEQVEPLTHSSSLPVDPYFLGLWLGEGSSDSATISTTDREVVVWLQQYVERLNKDKPAEASPLRLTKINGFKPGQQMANGSVQKVTVPTYTITSGESFTGGNWNPVYNGLKSMGLLGNKSNGIPEAYKDADLQSRLALLAGLVDSDGCYVESYNSYRFMQKSELHKKIVYDLKEMATSCGIETTDIDVSESRLYLGSSETTSAYVVYLGSGSEKLQQSLLLPRKKMVRTKSCIQESTPFKVQDVANGEFRAIEVSGGSFQLENGLQLKNCHLNTCPVGIATQDPDLRKKFEGTPEHVINFFYYLANELRNIMAQLGFRTINEMVGRAEKLKVREDLRNTKNANIDLSPILTPAHTIRPGVATHCVRKQDHKLHVRIDNKLIDESEMTLAKGLPVTIDCDVVNTDRTLGTTLSYRVSKTFGEQGLPHDTIHVNAKGSAGQSFGAFLASGITLELEGDANDYIGKGLSGGRIIVYPPRESKFNAEDQIIAGNTAFFGATSGTAFIRGIAAERFAVRNSGANIVTEGTGDHGCEYMSGGRVVVLGSTGRNFAAGMCGGIAYVLDMAQDFGDKVNTQTVELSSVTDPAEIAFLRGLIEDHRHYTESEVADRILNDFNRILPRFVKVLPFDYKKVLEKEKQKAEEAKKNELSTFLKSIKEDPEADVTNGEAAKIKKGHVHRPSKASEPPVLDVEDTVTDSAAAKKPVVKLDKVRGFMKYKRRNEKYRPATERSKDWKEMSSRLTKDELKHETARCMDCGVPFCTSDTGCPISNVIPKWNELVFQDRWYDAWQRLMMTNNFPEFTGRICPAPCNGACVLGINEDPVNIKSIECAIIDHAFEQGWVKPEPPAQRTGKTVAVIGSGPAGLAAADQLNKAGHLVTVFERSDRAGGLMMYGIPNMKLDKRLVKRRTDLMAAEGVEYRCNTTVGEDISVEELKSTYDAVVFAVGSTIPRDLKIPGRELTNIKFAMELLHSNTKALLDDNLEEIRKTLAGKHVVVIGGGDTGNDCLGTSTRHGAKSVTNFELLPTPPATRPKDNPWPQWPRIFRVDYGHTEVATHYGKDPREYSILSKEFVDDGEGNVKGIKTVRVEWKRSDSGAWQMAEVPGSEEFFPADVVLLSMGFVGPDADKLEVNKTKRGTIGTLDPNGYKVGANDNVFAAGDCRRGQSLVVWGIQEGRQCAREVDNYLMGSTRLPGNGSIEQRNYKLLEEYAEKV